MTADGLDGQPWAVAVAAVLTFAVVSLGVRPVLNRLPEPPEPDGKPTYRELGSRRFVLGCAVAGAVAAAIGWALLPVAVQPLWTVVSTLGVLLAAIDARTTWLPLVLTRVAWVAMTAAALLAAGLALDPWLGARAAVGALAAGALFGVAWLLTRGGFGFGDVRYVPLLGSAAAAASMSLLVWSLLLGSVAGALWGVARLVGGRRGSFPYAPPLLAGAYGAVIGLGVLG